MSYYIELLNFLWEKDAAFNFSPNEVGLYTYLLRLANHGRWSSLEIPLRDDSIRGKYGLGDDALKRARARIVEAGLVSFTPGNGRGKVAQYQLILPIKVIRNPTLSAGKGAGKGPSNPTPLFPVDPGKGPEKAPQIPTLSAPDPATVAQPGAPKIEDTIPSPIGEGREAEKKGGNASPKKPAAKKEDTAPAAPRTTVHQQCVDLYAVWFRKQTATNDDPDGIGPKIEPADGAGMKAIITYISGEVKKKYLLKGWPLTDAILVEQIVKIWGDVLDNTDKLRHWLKGRTRLRDFNSEFQNILIQTKNELLSRSQSVPLDPPAGAKNGGRGGSVSGLQNLKRG